METFCASSRRAHHPHRNLLLFTPLPSFSPTVPPFLLHNSCCGRELVSGSNELTAAHPAHPASAGFTEKQPVFHHPRRLHSVTLTVVIPALPSRWQPSHAFSPHLNPDTLSSLTVCLLVTAARNTNRLESATLSLSNSLGPACTSRHKPQRKGGEGRRERGKQGAKKGGEGTFKAGWRWRRYV